MRFQIEITSRSRRNQFIDLVRLFGVALGACGAAVYFLVWGSEPFWLRALGAVALVAIGGGSLCLARTTLGAWRQRPYLEATDDHVFVHDIEAFEDGVVAVPRASLRAVVVDAGDDSIKEGGRFPIDGAMPPGAEAWLYSAKGKSAIDMEHVGALDDVPNVVLLLDTPIELVPHRRLRHVVCNPRLFIRRTLRAVRMRLEHPQDAEALFRRWQLVRAVTFGDVAALQPTPEEQRRSRRLEIIQLVGVVLITAIAFGVPLWLALRDR